MEIRDRRLGDVTVIELDGRLTVNDQPGRVREAVSGAVAGGARHVLLDLSRVPYIDSTRLGELISAHVTVSRQGGALKLVGAAPRIAGLLAMAGLGDIFERFDTIDAAVDSLRA